MALNRSVLFVLPLLLAVGCGQTASAPEPAPPAAAVPVAAPAPAVPPASQPLPEVRISTNRGDLTVELFEDDAPNTVANFITLAESGYYEGCLFHRVIKDFMIQGGDPISKDPAAAGIGTGGPGYCIKCELNRRPHERGALSMAHAGKDTGGSQFFICHAAVGHLDGKHTVFGHVTAGLDVLDEIATTEVKRDDRPVQDVVISKVTVLRKRAHPYQAQKLPAR